MASPIKTLTIGSKLLVLVPVDSWGHSRKYGGYWQKEICEIGTKYSFNGSVILSAVAIDSLMELTNGVRSGASSGRNSERGTWVELSNTESREWLRLLGISDLAEKFRCTVGAERSVVVCCNDRLQKKATDSLISILVNTSREDRANINNRLVKTQYVLNAHVSELNSPRHNWIQENRVRLGYENYDLPEDGFKWLFGKLIQSHGEMSDTLLRLDEENCGKFGYREKPKPAQNKQSSAEIFDPSGQQNTPSQSQEQDIMDYDEFNLETLEDHLLPQRERPTKDNGEAAAEKSRHKKKAKHTRQEKEERMRRHIHEMN